MAVVFAENVVEIAVIQNYGNRRAVNVWHMWVEPELWPATPVEVVEDFRNNWQDHVLNLQVPEVEVIRFEWRSLDPSDSQVGTVSPDPAKDTSGQASAAGAPPNVALLVNKRTSSRPRGARDGRMFLTGVPEDQIDPQGEVATVALQSWQGHIDDFYNGISDTGVWTDDQRYPVVLETTPESRAPGTTPVTIDSRRVTSLPIDSLVSTQRDRLR